MGITLQNSLTNSVSTILEGSANRAKDLGKSLASGVNQRVDVTEKFLGKGLEDNSIISAAILKNVSYSKNLLDTANQYLETVAKSLQEAAKTAASSGPLSQDKLAILQRNIDDKLGQVAQAIETAAYDGKKVLDGDASSLNVKIGLNAADKIELQVPDIGENKILRSNLANRLNDYLGATAVATSVVAYYASDAEMAAAVKANENIIHNAIAGANGSGTGGAMAVADVAAALVAIRAADKNTVSGLTEALPIATAFMKGIAAANTWDNVSAADLTTTLGDGASLAEINAFLKDGAETKISDSTKRAVTLDVLSSSLNQVRIMQANISNQSNNITDSAEALRVTSLVTKDAAGAYLNTDYVVASQDFAQATRELVAGITAIQGNTKVADAALQALQGAAR